MLNVEHISSRSTVGNPQEVRCSAAALQCSIGDPACRLDPPCRLPAGWPPAFSSSHPCARICPSNPPCFQEPTSSPSPKPNQPTRLLCDGVSYLRQWPEAAGIAYFMSLLDILDYTIYRQIYLYSGRFFLNRIRYLVKGSVICDIISLKESCNVELVIFIGGI